MTKPIVYFTREITPENVVRLYEKLGVDLPGKVAAKRATRTTCGPSSCAP